MTGTMRIVTIMFLGATLLAPAAFADRGATVQRLDKVAIQPLDLGADTRQDCLAGNLNVPVYALTDYIFGDEVYAHSYGWWPGDADCTCPLGMRVEAVHMLVQFGPGDVPVTFDVMATAQTAAGLSMPPPCPWPSGFEYGVSGVHSVTIDTPGLYDIGLPLQSECAFVGHIYDVTFQFLDLFDPAKRPDLITDDRSDDWCLSFIEVVGGPPWEILQFLGAPGNAVIYAEISCCEMPVANEPATWGSVKGLYR
jgi:hypothetical protein